MVGFYLVVVDSNVLFIVLVCNMTLHRFEINVLFIVLLCNFPLKMLMVDIFVYILVSILIRIT